ncbi:MFS transporter [Kitasatospora aureofaciens]|uniref:MFS transporter n=1 Tax=Kitasatospora aureofaciens TaxID=1894 RepID=UPI0037C7A1E6
MSLLLSTVSATLAEMLIGPSLDELAVTTAPRRRTGRALGLLGLAGAIGFPLGAGLGTHLCQSLHGGPGVWLTITATAALAAACLLLPRPARHGCVQGRGQGVRRPRQRDSRVLTVTGRAARHEPRLGQRPRPAP